MTAPRPKDERRYWIAVASANHVARGVAGGFMQVNHGKLAPLRRIRAGDGVFVYSPLVEFGGTEKLMAFTAIGTVKPGEPYQGDMGAGFKPFRRDVAWVKQAKQAPIRELLSKLSFTTGQANWGYKFRFGLFEITVDDADEIATAMGAAPLLMRA